MAGEQFGPIGVEIVHYTRGLLAYLAPGADAATAGLELQTADAVAIEDWLEMETEVPLLDVEMHVSGNDRQRLNDTLTAFHTALPFNEAERDWLGRVHREEPGHRTVEARIGVIEAQEGQIMMYGVRKIVSGRDLMRRWITWRREADEYEGQGSLDQAREALGSLRDLLG
jgi:hypothetical protein